MVTQTGGKNNVKKDEIFPQYLKKNSKSAVLPPSEPLYLRSRRKVFLFAFQLREAQYHSAKLNITAAQYHSPQANLTAKGLAEANPFAGRDSRSFTK